MSDERFVILGGGLAGAKAAESLRSEGFEGPLVLVGAEGGLPYERPPLSKDFLRGEVTRESAYVHDQAFYEEHQIELRPSTRAVELRLAERELVLADGERLGFKSRASGHWSGAAAAADRRLGPGRDPLPARPRGLGGDPRGHTGLARSWSWWAPAGSARRWRRRRARWEPR